MLNDWSKETDNLQLAIFKGERGLWDALSDFCLSAAKNKPGGWSDHFSEALLALGSEYGL